MPKRKYTSKRRTTKRRRVGSRKGGSRRKASRKTFSRRSRPTTAVIRQPSGLPDRCFVKLKFGYFLQLTSTLGAVNNNIFRGNSVFDPDLTGTGTEAYLATWWLKNNTVSTTGGGYYFYRVLGSSIRIKASIQPGAGTASNVTLAVMPNANSTAYAATRQPDIIANPYTKYKMFSGNGPAVTMIKAYMSTAKIYGEDPKSITSEDNYQAAYNANPTNQWFWHVYMWSSDQATTSNPILCDMTITYYCELSNRNPIAQS